MMTIAFSSGNMKKIISHFFLYFSALINITEHQNSVISYDNHQTHAKTPFQEINFHFSSKGQWPKSTEVISLTPDFSPRILQDETWYFNMPKLPHTKIEEASNQHSSKTKFQHLK